MRLGAVPTVIRLGLGWWLVMVAYPLSRPFALYGSSLAAGKSASTAERVNAIAWSLGHALVTASILVKLLRRWNRKPTPLGAWWWGLGLGVFAMQSWWIAWTLYAYVGSGYRGLSFADMVEKAGVGLALLPLMGMVSLFPFTWPLWILGWLTAWFFPKLDTPRTPVPG